MYSLIKYGILFIFLSLASDVMAVSTKQPIARFPIISSIQNIFCEQVIHLLLLSKKDIAKECTKFALPVLISSRNQFIKNYAIDYSCEVAWTGYYDGIDAIPGALIRYACIDTCCHQLCKAGHFFEIDYPDTLKKHVLLYSAARVLTPLFIKRCIGIIIDTILNQLSECDEENDQMLEMAQSLT